MSAPVSTAAEMRAALIEAQADRAALAEILAIAETQAHNAAVRAWPGDLLVYVGAMQRGLGAEHEAVR